MAANDDTHYCTRCLVTGKAGVKSTVQCSHKEGHNFVTLSSNNTSNKPAISKSGGNGSNDNGSNDTEDNEFEPWIIDHIVWAAVATANDDSWRDDEVTRIANALVQQFRKYNYDNFKQFQSKMVQLLRDEEKGELNDAGSVVVDTLRLAEKDSDKLRHVSIQSKKDILQLMVKLPLRYCSMQFRCIILSFYEAILDKYNKDLQREEITMLESYKHFKSKCVADGFRGVKLADVAGASTLYLYEDYSQLVGGARYRQVKTSGRSSQDFEAEKA